MLRLLERQRQSFWSSLLWQDVLALSWRWEEQNQTWQKLSLMFVCGHGKQRLFQFNTLCARRVHAIGQYLKMGFLPRLIFKLALFQNMVAAYRWSNNKI